MPTMSLEQDDPRRLGRFTLTGRLGEGGQGIVYLGQGPTGKSVAVKVLRTSADSGTLQRLARELDAVHQVQPFVTAQVIETGVEGSQRFIVSEFIAGPSLSEQVAEHGPLRDGPLHRLAVGTATALTAIHGAGVVHRDFKPANVLLGPDGPRVVDFGIARLIDADTVTSHLIGTPAYLAPEQLRGGPLTPAVDIFAWAVTLTFAATGRAAFGSDTVPAVMNRILNNEPDLSGVPPLLRDVLAVCLSKDPRERPTARDLLVRLVDPSVRVAATSPDVRSAGPQDAPPGPRPAVSTTGRRRRSHGWIVSAALAFILVLSLGGWAYLARSGGRHTPASTSSHGAPTTPSVPSRPVTAATIPAAFGGSWTGTLKQTNNVKGDTLASQAIITLNSGQSTGTSRYQNWGCDGQLTLTRASGTTLVFDEVENGDSCLSGTVTLIKTANVLKYHWGTGPSGEVVDGSLTRSG